jgi:F-type H+-transporting ATPase subunit b
MEQLLTAFGIDGKLLIAQAVNFGVLFVALTYLLYKPTMKTLDERRLKVAKGVQDAEEAEKKLAEADVTVGEKLKGAESEAEGIVASAREAGTSEKARIVKDAETHAASIEAESEARAREAASRALKESEKEIARLAILAAEKAMRK